MSDTTALSHQYAASAAFAERMSRWALALKKAVGEADGPGGEEGRAGLAAVLARVLERLNLDQPVSDEAVPLVPEEFYERLEARHRSEADWFIEDLRAAHAALREGRPLDERAWAIVDEVGDAADATASASFRRLWRR